MKEEGKKNNNVPNLRFPEFKEEWVRTRLGDIAVFKKGKGISKNDISIEGKTDCIRYGELYTYYDEVIEDVISTTNLNPDNLILSEENDIIIPSSGESSIEIAKASCVQKSGVALGGDLNIIKTNSYGNFLAYYLNNKKKNNIGRIAQGSSVVHLYAKQLSKLNIALPTINEQYKIGSFLNLIEKRIKAQIKIIENLESLMKGLGKKIFSQKLRFHNVDGNRCNDWKKVKLEDVLEIGSGRDYKHLKEGNIPVFGTGGFMTSVEGFLYEGESVGIGRKGTIDKPVFLKGKFWTVDTLFYTHSFKQVFPKFIYYLFLQINWKKYNEATGVPSLSKSTIEKIKIKTPCLAEQTKILKFLSSFDEKIKSEKYLLQQYKKQKQYLLQNMFI